MVNIRIHKTFSFILMLAWLAGCVVSVRFTTSCRSSIAAPMSCCQSSSTVGVTGLQQILSEKSCHCPVMATSIPESNVSLPIETPKSNKVNQSYDVLNFTSYLFSDNTKNTSVFTSFYHHSPAKTSLENNALLSTFRI